MERLPTVLCANIFSFLDVRQHVDLSCCCKRFGLIARYPIASLRDVVVLRSTQLNLYASSSFSRRPHALHITKGTVNSSAIASIAQGVPHLRCLNFRYESSHVSLAPLSKLANLTQLDLTVEGKHSSSSLRCLSSLSSLTWLRLPSLGRKDATDALPHSLTFLEVSSSVRNVQALGDFARRGLRFLRLPNSYLGDIKSRDSRYLASPHLQSLHCKRLWLPPGVLWPRLTDLQCRLGNGDTLLALQSYITLESLDLWLDHDDGRVWQAAITCFPRLTKFSNHTVSPINPATIRISVPPLQMLDIGYYIENPEYLSVFSTLTSLTLRELDRFMPCLKRGSKLPVLPHLVRLDMQMHDCPSLSELGKQYPSLTWLRTPSCSLAQPEVLNMLCQSWTQLEVLHVTCKEAPEAAHVLALCGITRLMDKKTESLVRCSLKEEKARHELAGGLSEMEISAWFAYLDKFRPRLKVLTISWLEEPMSELCAVITQASRGRLWVGHPLQQPSPRTLKFSVS